MSFVTKLTGLFVNPNEKELKKITPLVEEINGLEKDFKKFSEEQIREKTFAFKKELKEGKKLDEILPSAFALCREAGQRALGMRAFDSQLMGGIALHQGKIAEMKTGEGKTLAACFAVYLNALEGKGVHVITVNDYLARRDTNWMGVLYNMLGLSVGCVQHDVSYVYDPKVGPDEDEVSIEYENLRKVPRGEAYKADITYGTNNEFGFDYLRDNMVQDISQMSQVRDPKALAKEEKEKLALKKEQDAGKRAGREAQDEKTMLKKRYLNFAIVDEVDSILIDEARTPLIISAPDAESAKLYQTCAKVVPNLKENKDYNLDEKMQAVTLTDEGITNLEKRLSIKNLYAPENMRWVHHLHQALKAEVVFKKDKQYVVQNNEVMIVDDFTGRLMPGRRFSEGLHQALEAKEGVPIQRESRTLATITFQNFFRLYKKLAGMTGTAMTSAEEFSKVYELDILSVPTNKVMVRKDERDKIYKNQKGKLTAIAQEVKERHKKGQPVLIGTISVDKSEEVAQYLERAGVEYEILNAKNHEREAQIIQDAGQKSAVTIATNMAGRGTDIKLGKGVTELGGLHILGTERHEARRIDNQLRGRAGRQGDPGSSQFYVSLEDELMRRFGSDKIKGMMDTLGLPEDQPIQNRLISGSIESAQKKIEGYNFDIRKHVLEYDDVINRQREAIYQKRRQILLGVLDRGEIDDMIEKLIENVVNFHTQAEMEKDWNVQEIFEYSQSLFNASAEFKETLEKARDKSAGLEEKRKELVNLVIENAKGAYDIKEKTASAKGMRYVERLVMLKTIDQLWMDHLDNMQYLREGIGLRGYGQRDPLIEYKREGFDLFQELLSNIRLQTIETLFKATVQVTPPGGPGAGPGGSGGGVSAGAGALPGQGGALGAGAGAGANGLALGGGISGANLRYQGGELSQQSLTGNGATGSAQAKAQAAGGGSNKTDTGAPIKTEKVGRNEPCPCGSGKKFKKCCGRRV